MATLSSVGGSFYDTIALYEWWLMILYHHDGWTHVRRHRRKLIPKLVIISREKSLADQRD
jgi:hypothetical protein